MINKSTSQTDYDRETLIFLQTSKQVDLLIEQGLHPSDAWNSCSQELTEVSLSHLRCFVISSFETALRTKVMSNEVLQVLSTLMRLSALFWIKRHLGDFIAHANLQVNRKF